MSQWSPLTLTTSLMGPRKRNWLPVSFSNINLFPQVWAGQQRQSLWTVTNQPGLVIRGNWLAPECLTISSWLRSLSGLPAAGRVSAPQAVNVSWHSLCNVPMLECNPRPSASSTRLIVLSNPTQWQTWAPAEVYCQMITLSTGFLLLNAEIC